MFYRKFSPFYNLAVFYIIVCLILRITLFFHPITQSSFGFLDSLKIFFLGLISDVFVFIVASGFLWLYLIFLSNSKYLEPYGYIIFGILLSLFIYVLFFNTILNEYGGAAPEIGRIFIGLKTILFGLLLFLPKYRSKIRFWLFSLTIFIYVVCIVQNAISEYLFWNEFGVRYNFIAVDYLVYTNEVIGNIMQSYPVVPIFSGLFLVAGIFTYFIVRKSKNYLNEIPTFTQKIKLSAVYLGLFLVSLVIIPFLSSKENSQNIFTNELQAMDYINFIWLFQTVNWIILNFTKLYPITMLLLF